MRIQWSPEYELGIDLIDRQHRRIVDYINTLDELVDKPGARLGVARVLHDLVDYTESHFGFEEALLAEAGFAGLESHRHTHERFTQRIAALQAQHEAGEDVAKELLTLLEKWLIHHILEEDAAYTAQVRALIERIGREGLGAWTNEHLRRYFRQA